MLQVEGLQAKPIGIGKQMDKVLTKEQNNCFDLSRSTHPSGVLVRWAFQVEGLQAKPIGIGKQMDKVLTKKQNNCFGFE